MENPEEILHSLEEFSKMKPKDIPRELEEYLCFVAKTGNPVYQWPTIKSLFREKLLNVITEFYESCPSVDIPPCPNVDMFNYDLMKNFILEKLDTFASAPFTVQRICELLTTPRKEYNRIDKYMRALEKNILVVSTTEPGRRSTENGEGIMNGIESEHLPESSNSSHDINVDEMDETPSWPRTSQVVPIVFESNENETQPTTEALQNSLNQQSFESDTETKLEILSTSITTSTPSQGQSQQETVITCRSMDDTQQPYVSIEPVPLDTCTTSHQEAENESDVSVTITAVPAGVQQRRNSVERLNTTDILVSEVEAVNKTITPEEIKKVTELEEKHKEHVLPTVSCSEHREEPLADSKVLIQPQDTNLVVQEELGIENISPENSSSSPDILQIEVSSEVEKCQPEAADKVEQIFEQHETEETKNIIENSGNTWVAEIKGPEAEVSLPEIAETSDTDAKLDVNLESVIPDCSNASIEESGVVEKIVESTCSDVEEQIEENSEKYMTTVEIPRERVEEPELVEDNKMYEVTETKKHDEEVPMEIDIVNETELDKQKDCTDEECSSTTMDAL